MQDKDLDRLFAVARAQSPAPSEALMARVMADALAEMPTTAAEGAALPAPRRASQRRFALLWQGLVAGFGGTSVMASLGLVTVVALGIGYSYPAALNAAGIESEGDAAIAALFAMNEGGDHDELLPVAAYFLNEG